MKITQTFNHLIMYILLSTTLSAHAANPAPTNNEAQTTKHKQMAQQVLELLFTPSISLETKKANIGNYISDEKYINHSPRAKDGIENIIKFIEFADKNIGPIKVSVKYVIGDGNMVAVYSHYLLGSNDILGKNVVDIFRFEADKIVEHWDVLQEITDK